MIEQKELKQLIDNKLDGTPLFLVDLQIRPKNKIIVLIDNDNGVQIEDCALVSKAIEEQYGEELQNYEVQVSSPGADRPFAVLRQYKKNIDKEIEVLTVENLKIAGILLKATEENIELAEKKNKKNKNENNILLLNYNQIKEAKRIVSLK